MRNLNVGNDFAAQSLASKEVTHDRHSDVTEVPKADKAGGKAKEETTKEEVKAERKKSKAAKG